MLWKRTCQNETEWKKRDNSFFSIFPLDVSKPEQLASTVCAPVKYQEKPAPQSFLSTIPLDTKPDNRETSFGGKKNYCRRVNDNLE